MECNDNDTLQDDLSATHMLIKGMTGQGHSTIYPFTNENLRAYLPFFDLEGKDVLTVTASGDHPLNMILQGAKNVTTFDINKLAYYWFELKKAGVLTLSLDDFKKFFMDEMQKEKYKQVRPALEKDTKEYWDEIIDTYPPILPLNSTDLFKKSQVVACRDTERNLYLKSNRYLDDDGYQKLKQKLPNFQMDFINCHIYDLELNTNQQFDAIFTSNICDYVGGEKYKRFAENNLRRMLRKNGVAQVAHRYNSTSYFWSSIFSGHNYEEKSFRSLKNVTERGSVISLHK
ncbi:MAG: BtaA family protein [Firmicutes bacterium]|nr:BtaA family protein [Bacillota bacterium]